jgi:hypothetical protein
VDAAWNLTPREVFTCIDAIYQRKQFYGVFALAAANGPRLERPLRRVEDLIGPPPFAPEPSAEDDAEYSRRIAAHLHKRWPEKYPAPEVNDGERPENQR